MLIGIFSDLHGNSDVLDFLIANVFKQVDHIWCLGDSFHVYNLDANSREKAERTLKTLQNYNEKPIDFIQGNCDTFPEYKAFSRCVPEESTVKEVDGLKLVLTHGNKCESFQEKQQLLQDHQAKILLYGHTHLFEIQAINDLIFLNPGSVSYPRNEHGIASYMLLDTATKHLQLNELSRGDLLQEIYLYL